MSCSLLFLHKHYFIQDLHKWKMIGLDEQSYGLYYLLSTSVQSAQPQVLYAAHANSGIWHLRLRHPSQSRLSILNKTHPEIMSCTDFQYNVCPLAKQKRLTFTIVPLILSQLLLYILLYGPPFLLFLLMVFSIFSQ